MKLSYSPVRPRRSLTSSANIAIVQVIKSTSEGLTADGILTAIQRDHPQFVAELAVKKELSNRLSRLTTSGHIERFRVDNAWAWKAIDHCPRVASAGSGYVVPPRRLDVMSGTYTPPVTALRPGAMDYAAVPSLHMGRRRAFRSDLA
ncbi:MAG: hypothetical protein KF796_19205 [Ramlibacter sp.]|nr:hypothetical protein [Ramlibacter sp.]